MKRKEKKFINCCICGRPIIEGEGNNPDGAVWKNEQGDIIEGVFKDTDECCDSCNNKYVIAGRLYRMFYKGK